MRGLRKFLTPFAPDQSGAVSVFYEFGGIIVICDAGGCTGNGQTIGIGAGLSGTEGAGTKGIRLGGSWICSLSGTETADDAHAGGYFRYP